MDRLDCIRAFLKAARTLIPLNGKVPVDKKWPQTPQGKWNDKNLVGNYGVVLKETDVVIDVDPRNFPEGDRVFDRLAKDIGVDLPATLIVGTGGGGYHLYLTKPGDFPIVGSLREYPGVEFKSTGRQVVGPGSIHPDTKQPYIIRAGSPAQIGRMPGKWLEKIRAKPAEINEKGTAEYKDDPITIARYDEFLRQADPAIQGGHGDDRTFVVAARGRDMGLPPNVTLDRMLATWNLRCKPEWTADELREKVKNAYLYARGAVGSAHPAADFGVIENGAPEHAPSWVTDKNGVPTRCFQNLVNYFIYPAYGLLGVFGYNEFTSTVCFTAPAPWHKGKMPLVPSVMDHDLKLLKGYLAIKEGFEMPVNIIYEALVVTARQRPFHPVRDWLSKLRWDGKERLDTWLMDYVGAEDTPYVRAVSRKTLCAAVKRTLHPGCKFDHVLVLEGPQDFGKSAVCRILGGEWAADFPVDPHQKDTIQLMQGKWIIEMAELEVFKRTDIDALKAFLTRPADEVRLPYEALDRKFPRQSIFIATYNPRADGVYLLDETGNRRWWPVVCAGRQANFAGLQRDRDQLFAEAYYRVTTIGEDLYMHTEELKESARKIVAERQIEHPWAERISIWLQSLKEIGVDRPFLTGREVFIDAMGGIDKQFTRREQLHVAQAMRVLGWAPYVKREGDRLIRGYEQTGRKYKVEQSDLALLGDLV